MTFYTLSLAVAHVEANLWEGEKNEKFNFFENFQIFKTELIIFRPSKLPKLKQTKSLKPLEQLRYLHYFYRSKTTRTREARPSHARSRNHIVYPLLSLSWLICHLFPYLDLRAGSNTPPPHFHIIFPKRHSLGWFRYPLYPWFFLGMPSQEGHQNFVSVQIFVIFSPYILLLAWKKKISWRRVSWKVTKFCSEKLFFCFIFWYVWIFEVVPLEWFR